MNEIVKLPITYRMKKGNCTAETCIDLPITKSAYDSLAKEMAQYGFNIQSDQGKPPQLIRTALNAIVKLQGYDELTAIIVEIKIGEDSK
jgi:hypothetical protein